MGRNWPKPIVVSTAVLGAGAMAAGTFALTGCSADSSGSGTSDARNDDKQSTHAPAPPPAGPVETGPAPSAIPSVRGWKAERGTGWKPTEQSRVVTGEPELSDEARLLARELDIPYARAAKARPGDVRLASGAEELGREGYELTTRKGEVTISGGGEAGVFYGTRTLKQALKDRGRIADGTVRDKPDRPQRGFSLDVARKHYSPGWIEERIKEMGELKLNQLQLHLTDDQAFRIESDSHPEVVSQPHLTKDEMRRIVKLAESRHISVIPEIDSPGHLGAVIKAHPDLQLRDKNGTATRGAVDITNPKAGKIVDDLLKEYAEIFPGKYWHLGGDEYRALMEKDPEAAYPQLTDQARKRFGGGGRVQDLATAWVNDRAETVRKAGKTPQVWNDGMHRQGRVKPHRDREVAYWTGKEPGARQPEEYLKEGWKTVNLNDEYLYYVLGEPNDFTYPTGERIYKDWTPDMVRGSKRVPKELSGPGRIPGGRFAVWSDIADAQTQQQVAEGIRMPLAATAQKLWNPQEPRLGWGAFKRLADRLR
jgi:hexosaminidase